MTSDLQTAMKATIEEMAHDSWANILPSFIEEYPWGKEVSALVMSEVDRLGLDTPLVQASDSQLNFIFNLKSVHLTFSFRQSDMFHLGILEIKELRSPEIHPNFPISEFGSELEKYL